MICNFIRCVFAIFSYVLMMITGWTSINGFKNITTKNISIGLYCHTSFWDGIIGLMVTKFIGYYLSYDFYFVIKESLLGPLPIWLQEKMGIVLIKRGKGGSVNQIINRFHNKKRCCILISPEGTRSKIEKWHTGPLIIADKLNADVLTFGMDFSKYKIDVQKIEEKSIENIKNILEKYSIPLYPKLTSLDVKKDIYTSPINYVIFTLFLLCLSIFLWNSNITDHILILLGWSLYGYLKFKTIL